MKKDVANAILKIKNPRLIYLEVEIARLLELCF